MIIIVIMYAASDGYRESGGCLSSLFKQKFKNNRINISFF